MAPVPLTVIIPYFKRRFVGEVISSLRAQTCQDFHIIVADDASPEPCPELFAEAFPSDRLVYHRFEKNLGGTSLPQHWDRSVKLSSTPWVWLFSDDDVLPPDCVATLLEAVRNSGSAGPADVYRFNTVIIDQDSKTIRQPPANPARETAEEFLMARFDLKRESFAPDHVFSRRAFDREGGFIDFPLAWFSDTASWAAFGRETGIRTLDGPRVHWRLSGANLSSTNPKLALRKWNGFLQFLNWTEESFPSPDFLRTFWRTASEWSPHMVEPWGGPIGFGPGFRIWLRLFLKSRRPNRVLLRRLSK